MRHVSLSRATVESCLATTPIVTNALHVKHVFLLMLMKSSTRYLSIVQLLILQQHNTSYFAYSTISLCPSDCNRICMNPIMYSHLQLYPPQYQKSELRRSLVSPPRKTVHVLLALLSLACE